MKFIDDAIKESEQRMEDNTPKKISSDIDEELISIMDGVKTNICVVGAGGAGKAAALAMCDAGYEVCLINRSAGKVEDFANAIGAVYVPFSDVVECLSAADIV